MIQKLFNRINQFIEHPLAGKRPAAAFFRYLAFHIQHSIYPKPRIYSFVGDTKFIAERGMAGIVGNIYTGLHEFEEMGFLLHYLNSEDTFLDIGANVGAFSLLASGVKQARSFAVEPVPATFEQLHLNIHLNHLESLAKCFQLGLSDAEGMLEFSQDKGTMNRVVKGSQSSCKVAVQTADQFIQTLGVVPNLVKIDVEGFECPVLKGGVNLFSNPDCKAVIIELNGSGKRYGFSDDDVHDFLVSNAFQPAHYDPFKRQLKVLPGYKKEKFNTIYVKDYEAVQLKLEQSPKIKVLNQIF